MSTPAAAPAAPVCAAVTAPRALNHPRVDLPASFTSARLGGVVVDEAVVGADGAVSDVRTIHARIDSLAPFGQKAVRETRFSPGAVDGHPAAMRVRVATTLGTVTRARVEPEYDSVWAFVPAGGSRESVWQLAGSVDRLGIAVHLGTAFASGGEVVAKAPGGATLVLRKIAPSGRPVDLNESVGVGKFFDAPGDYRIELRSVDGGPTLGWTTVTIADDFTRAIVNLCEPL